MVKTGEEGGKIGKKVPSTCCLPTVRDAKKMYISVTIVSLSDAVTVLQ